MLTADKYDSKSDAEISDYLERHDFISANNIDYHLDKYMRNSDLVTEDSLSDSIHDWMGRNFDISDYEIEDAVKEAVRSMDFTVEVS